MQSTNNHLSQGLFLTGTGTDIGKTYIAALIVKKLRDANMSVGYYKAALSGVNESEENDAARVARIANLSEDPRELVSYFYRDPVSPHLAAKFENNPIQWEKVTDDFNRAKKQHDYLLVEGSGGIVCPLRVDDKKLIMLEDIPEKFHLPALIVSTAKLGAINAAVLTVYYLRGKNIPIKGIVINDFDENSVAEKDTVHMIERLTNCAIVAVVPHNATDLGANVQARDIAALFS